MFSIEGKVAVVTGSARGLGQAIVERFAAAGAKVTLVDWNDAGELAAGLGGDFVKADVSDEAQIAAMLEGVAAKHGRIDILVNNAAHQPLDKYLTEDDAEEFTRTFQINVNGVFYGLKHAPGHMPEGASIINTASISALAAQPGYGRYGATKGAVIHLTQASAVELGPRGIRVNCVCPGVMRTPVVTDVPGEPETRMAELQAPLGYAAEPEDVAPVYHFLASSESAYVTGAAIVADGGVMAGWPKTMVERLINR
jgi:NAD(P)-dependent dehydrogenase (short-subunit alcohol dehydrogenase family)